MRCTACRFFLRFSAACTPHLPRAGAPLGFRLTTRHTILLFSALLTAGTLFAACYCRCHCGPRLSPLPLYPCRTAHAMLLRAWNGSLVLSLPRAMCAAAWLVHFSYCPQHHMPFFVAFALPLRRAMRWTTTPTACTPLFSLRCGFTPLIPTASARFGLHHAPDTTPSLPRLPARAQVFVYHLHACLYQTDDMLHATAARVPTHDSVSGVPCYTHHTGLPTPASSRYHLPRFPRSLHLPLVQELTRLLVFHRFCGTADATHGLHHCLRPPLCWRHQNTLAVLCAIRLAKLALYCSSRRMVYAVADRRCCVSAPHWSAHFRAPAACLLSRFCAPRFRTSHCRTCYLRCSLADTYAFLPLLSLVYQLRVVSPVALFSLRTFRRTVLAAFHLHCTIPHPSTDAITACLRFMRCCACRHCSLPRHCAPVHSAGGRVPLDHTCLRLNAVPKRVTRARAYLPPNVLLYAPPLNAAALRWLSDTAFSLSRRTPLAALLVTLPLPGIFAGTPAFRYYRTTVAGLPPHLARLAYLPYLAKNFNAPPRARASCYTRFCQPSCARHLCRLRVLPRHARSLLPASPALRTGRILRCATPEPHAFRCALLLDIFLPDGLRADFVPHSLFSRLPYGSASLLRILRAPAAPPRRLSAPALCYGAAATTLPLPPRHAFGRPQVLDWTAPLAVSACVAARTAALLPRCTWTALPRSTLAHCMPFSFGHAPLRTAHSDTRCGPHLLRLRFRGTARRAAVSFSLRRAWT